ncbi:MAG: methylated-DNA--[protein]-cysteine S-methyltransferase [Eubacteriales bacterium]|nr:methylated-DNA--[protein]-cysteine S-methyltransferase [Eubacteriales bacterium]
MKDSFIYKSPIGMLKICENEGRITNLYLQQGDPSMVSMQNNVQHSDLLYEAYKQLEEYFRGNRKQFDLPLHYAGTPFQRQVWSELQNIPYGETRCYEDIAIGIGNEKAVRAVGQANNRNPIMIIVPCHRVIRKNGEIGGFGCGIEVKEYLLNLEKGKRK